MGDVSELGVGKGELEVGIIRDETTVGWVPGQAEEPVSSAASLF